MIPLAELAVVIPARNESELIARCLDSVMVAGDRLTARLGDTVALSVTMVADGCDDDTAALAGGYPVTVIEVPQVGVGAARAVGIAHRLRSSSVDPAALWIANTDADSVVHPGWILAQVAAARAGADARLGAVRPRFSDLSAEQVRSWRARHTPGATHGHVHGANLGVRASRYLEVGGFRPLLEHEDVELVGRLDAAGARIRYADRADVVTSGRSFGRTPGGYAGYLRNLSLERVSGP